MQFTDIIKGNSEEIVEVMTLLQTLILSLDERIEEDIYGGKVVKMASYSIGRKDNVIAVIGPGKDHCKLFLHHIDKIDSKGLKLEGKGKHTRHIKIKSRQQMDDAAYAEVLQKVVDIVITKL